jgi:hypothetical protein
MWRWSGEEGEVFGDWCGTGVVFVWEGELVRALLAFWRFWRGACE